MPQSGVLSDSDSREMDLIQVYLYTGMPYNILIVLKSQKHFASHDCLDVSRLHDSVRHHTFSEVYTCLKSYFLLTQEIFILGFCCQKEKCIFYA